MKGKVLFLVNHEIVIYNFRKEIVERLLSEGYEVIISSPHGKKIDELISMGCQFEEVNMDRHGTNFINEFNLLYYYSKLFDKIKPDIILGFTIKPNIYGAIAAKKRNIPFVANITGLGSAVENAGVLQKFTIGLYKFAFTDIKTVFFQNEENRQFFIDNNIAIDKHKILPGSGVNLEQFYPIHQKKIGDRISFLFIGRLMREKGIEEYLEAANSLIDTHNNLEFQILGSFEEEEYKKILEDNKNPNIKYLGISSDVRNEIKNVDCVVNPSYHEGMSNVLLESAAMGKPLLASNIPGCKEIIEDGQNGFLFKSQSTDSLKNVIIKFIKLNQEEREVMGRKSRNKIKKEFDRQIVVDSYLEEIQNILGE